MTVGLEFFLVIGWPEIFKHRVVFGVEGLEFEVMCDGGGRDQGIRYLNSMRPTELANPISSQLGNGPGYIVEGNGREKLVKGLLLIFPFDAGSDFGNRDDGQTYSVYMAFDKIAGQIQTFEAVDKDIRIDPKWSAHVWSLQLHPERRSRKLGRSRLSFQMPRACLMHVSR